MRRAAYAAAAFLGTYIAMALLVYLSLMAILFHVQTLEKVQNAQRNHFEAMGYMAMRPYVALWAPTEHLAGFLEINESGLAGMAFNAFVHATAFSGVMWLLTAHAARWKGLWTLYFSTLYGAVIVVALFVRLFYSGHSWIRSQLPDMYARTYTGVVPNGAALEYLTWPEKMLLYPAAMAYGGPYFNGVALANGAALWLLSIGVIYAGIRMSRRIRPRRLERLESNDETMQA